MADAKVIERIERLIALAASTNEHEARNAAMLACKLIRDHKVKLGGAPMFDVLPEMHVNVAHSVTLEDVFETLFGSERVNQAKTRAGGGFTPETSKPKAKKVTRSPRMKNGAVLIEAKHGGTCLDCGDRFDAGDSVWWKQGIGCVHEECDPTELT